MCLSMLFLSVYFYLLDNVAVECDMMPKVSFIAEIRNLIDNKDYFR